MKWILTIFGVVVALISLAAIIGALLPKGHVARRSAQFAQPADSVWAVISDFASQAAWRPDIKAVERLDDRNGKPVWREVSKGGDKVPYETTEMDAPRRLVRTIADPSLPFGGRWLYEIVPAAGGSRLTITEEGEVYNPVFRFVSHFFLDMGATAEAYLKALGARFGETPHIETVDAPG
jgi:uncharacterized protein YndB with AHSA1/START domain